MSIFTARRKGKGDQAVITRPINTVWYPEFSFAQPTPNVLIYQGTSFSFVLDTVHGAAYTGSMSVDDFAHYPVLELKEYITAFKPRTGGLFAFDWWVVAPAGSQSAGQPTDIKYHYEIAVRDPLPVTAFGHDSQPASINGSQAFTSANGYTNDKTIIADTGGSASVSVVRRVATGQEVYFDGLYNSVFREPTAGDVVAVIPPMLQDHFQLVITRLAD